MTPPKDKSLIIVGDRQIAHVAFEYFTQDSAYEVAAFAVERAFLARDELFGRPVLALETLEATHPPTRHEAFVAVGFARLNRIRARLYAATKAKGYTMASYVSSRAFVWPNVPVGDNCFILEGNVIQPFARIGNDVTLWSGNHIGHHATIADHVFLASHVVLSGSVEVGRSCFVGVNATVAHGVKIGDDALIGAGTTILRDVKPRSICAADETQPRRIDTFRFFRLDADADRDREA